MMSDKAVELLTEIRNWVRAGAHQSVKSLLDAALESGNDRSAFQMLDGTASFDSVCQKCKISKRDVVALAQRCVAMGLMEVTDEGRRRRLFDLREFGLLTPDEETNDAAKKGNAKR